MLRPLRRRGTHLPYPSCPKVCSSTLLGRVGDADSGKKKASVRHLPVIKAQTVHSSEAIRDRRVRMGEREREKETENNYIQVGWKKWLIIVVFVRCY